MSENNQAMIAPKISVYALAQEVSDQENAMIIIDIRDTNDFKAGSIKGAINFPLKTTMDWSEALINYRDSKFVFVCYKGFSGQELSNVMKDAGFDAYNLEGGMLAWRDAGFPLS